MTATIDRIVQLRGGDSGETEDLRGLLSDRRLTTRGGGPTVHYMVNYQHQDLDRVFGALVDPSRRAILARLEREESLSIGALAAPLKIKLPAVMKHLDVLGHAGLITRSKHGRTVDVRLSPSPLREATEWLRPYERFWAPALDRLAAHAESLEAQARDAESGPDAE